jgi:hypothetical protein
MGTEEKCFCYSFVVAGIPLHPIEKIADPSGPTGMMSVDKWFFLESIDLAKRGTH